MKKPETVTLSKKFLNWLNETIKFYKVFAKIKLPVNS